MRPVEFSDLEGLMQGLSTGIQVSWRSWKSGMRSGPVRGGGLVLRLAPRPVFLAGREELLAELDARLAGGDGGGPRVAALCGLGGAGKTSVAVEYAHRHLAEVEVCWQFPAEDPAVLAAEFGVLAAQLGVREAAMRGIRWRRSTRCWPVPGRVAGGVRQRAGPGVGGGVRAARRAAAGRGSPSRTSTGRPARR